MILQLSQGKSTIIDREDYPKIQHLKWWAAKLRGEVWAAVSHKDKRVWLHRLIMDCPPDMVVDHINGDVLDNRKINLRICTFKENTRNRRLYKNNKTGYKGVEYDKTREPRPWRARIYIQKNGIKIKSRSSKFYATREEAALAYNQMASELYGEFARFNILK